MALTDNGQKIVSGNDNLSDQKEDDMASEGLTPSEKQQYNDLYAGLLEGLIIKFTGGGAERLINAVNTCKEVRSTLPNIGKYINGFFTDGEGWLIIDTDQPEAFVEWIESLINDFKVDNKVVNMDSQVQLLKNEREIENMSAAEKANTAQDNYEKEVASEEVATEELPTTADRTILDKLKMFYAQNSTIVNVVGGVIAAVVLYKTYDAFSGGQDVIILDTENVFAGFKER